MHCLPTRSIPYWTIQSYLILLAICSSIQTFAIAEETQPRGRALIVAVTNYPTLAEHLHLKGPANDAKLMQRLLIDKFKFPPENVVLLVESSNKKLLPTRLNIIRELDLLAKKAKPNEQVVVFLAGHGSQQPDDDPNNPDDPEPDGFDEVFLPRDIGKWDSEVSTVTNAITDDDLRFQIAKIQKSEAFVWLIVDSCHSGTMLRGGGGDTVRQVPPSLLVPEETLTNAKTIPNEVTPKAPTPTLNLNKVVAIYASQSTEPTIEKLLPRGGNPKKPYGLLTYTINSILTNTTSPITYRELASRVHQQYVAWGRTYPTPLIEGGASDREVLGLREWPRRSHIQVVNNGGKFRINSGSLHGITPNSILRILNPPGSSNSASLISYAKVTTVTAMDAIIKPVEFEGKPANTGIPDGARAELVYRDFGLNALLLCVDQSDFQNKPRGQNEPNMLVNVAKTIQSTKFSGVSVVEDLKDAEWLLQSINGEVFITSALSLVSNSMQSASQHAFGPVPRENSAEWVIERLHRIHRAQNLLGMAMPAMEGAKAKSGIDIQLSLVRFQSLSDDNGESIMFSDRGRILRKNDVVGFEITNNSKEPIDVTLLFIDSTYGISSYFPRTGTLNDNRIPPGKTVNTARSRVTSATAMEHMLLIAVKSKARPIDFSCLEQPSIEYAQTRGGISALESPLGNLFKNALYQTGSTRGLSLEVIDDHSIQVLSWQVKDAP